MRSRGVLLGSKGHIIFPLGGIGRLVWSRWDRGISREMIPFFLGAHKRDWWGKGQVRGLERIFPIRLSLRAPAEVSDRSCNCTKDQLIVLYI